MAALAVACAAIAAEPVLYKLVDRQGRVTYADHVPKNFDGTVTRLESEASTNVLPGTAGRAEVPPLPPATSAIAEKRRQARESLEKKLREAQARVEAARKALDGGHDPRDDELQTIQHRRPPLAAGETPPNPNCFSVTAPDGTVTLNCPTRVPDEAYYARQAKLKEELRAAEEALAAAEFAYRRGTD